MKNKNKKWPLQKGEGSTIVFVLLIWLFFGGMYYSQASVLNTEKGWVESVQLVKINLVTDSTTQPSEKKVKIVDGMFQISAYSELDSCHYPTKGGCLTASGKIAKKGMCACSRKYQFGTQFEINGSVYTCEDRLAERFDHRIDLFMGYGEEAHTEAIKWGIKTLPVNIF